MDKPRFTLLAILGCTTALCVALAIFVLGNTFYAVYCFPLVVGGCVGYLLRGWRGLCMGAFLAALGVVMIGLPGYVFWLLLNTR